MSGTSQRNPTRIGGYASTGASFGVGRVHRYTLTRTWAPSEPRRRLVLWIMLNPSTADEHRLDPTLRRCEGFSFAWGFDGFTVVNLFALRSTDPKALYTHPDPVGEGNDAAIGVEAAQSDLIVCGWGAEPIAQPRAAAVARLLRSVSLWCLGENRDGSPRHPLYLPYAQPRVRWRVPASLTEESPQR